eukprot:4256962-Pleurochrysis_carterae.AAC.1
MEASALREVGRMVAQKAHERAPRRKLGAVDDRPAAVGRMVFDFGSFGCGPADRIVSHSLFPRFWVGGDCGRSQGAAVAAYVAGSGVMRVVTTCDEQSGRTQGVRTKSPLEVLGRRCRSVGLRCRVVVGRSVSVMSLRIWHYCVDRRRDSHGYRQCASPLSTVRLRERVVLWSHRSDGLSDIVIHVRGVSCRAAGGPAPVGRFDAATLSDVRGMCAAQRGQVSEFWRDAGHDEQRSVLLRRRSQGALWEGKSRASVGSAESINCGHHPQ